MHWYRVCTSIGTVATWDTSPVNVRPLQCDLSASQSPGTAHQKKDQSGSAADWRPPKSGDQEDDGWFPSDKGNRPRDRAEWTMVLRYGHLRSAPVLVDVRGAGDPQAQKAAREDALDPEEAWRPGVRPATLVVGPSRKMRNAHGLISHRRDPGAVYKCWAVGEVLRDFPWCSGCRGAAGLEGCRGNNTVELTVQNLHKYIPVPSRAPSSR